MSMYERFNIQNQVEHLQMKYVGTGHADTTQWEWATNMKRDTLSSHIGHSSRMNYFSVIENESSTRLKYKFITQMIQPCGPPDQKVEIK